MKNRYFLTAVIIFAAVSWYVAGSAAVSVPENTDNKSKAMEKAAENVVKIKLEAFQYGFSPDVIEVKKGDKVVITATTRDVAHGFYIKEYGINQVIKPGKETEIKFTADKTGEFTIICSVFCGSGHADMKAKLIVGK